MRQEISMRIVPLFVVICFVLPVRAHAQGGASLDIEGGAVYSGYNDIRIPGTTGTFFSLVEDLETDPSAFFRVRISYTMGNAHTFSLLAAPLRLGAEGSFPTTLLFDGEAFPADTPLKARYRFDSYRFTYRYQVHRSSSVRAGFGFTGKIRDAAVRIEGGGRKAEKTNTGFVPLLNFSCAWMVRPHYVLLFEGDALAAPQGRAEDVLLALLYEVKRYLTLKIGYRLLEGGADNDEVYSFALLHYAVLGAVFTF